MLRALAWVCAMAVVSGTVFAARSGSITLPSGWRLTPPQGPLLPTGPMPQGIAISPDGTKLAIVESGVPPAALRIVELRSLRAHTIALKGAFGKPLWLDETHVAVAGANTDAIAQVDTGSGSVHLRPSGKGSWPAAIAALADRRLITANDGDGTVNIGTMRVAVGEHPADLAVSPDGKIVYAAVRSPSSVVIIDATKGAVIGRIATGLHPSALLLSSDGATLYAAEADDDEIAAIDTRKRAIAAQISVGLHEQRTSGYGASPNGLALHGNELFVSLGAQNAIAVVRANRLVQRIPAGWYPTGVAIAPDGTLYVIDGKGERAPPNPQFDPLQRRSAGYVGAITIGSLRAIPRDVYESAGETRDAIANDGPQWTVPAQTVLRANGPIRHVIYVIKENRSYDQVLGDVRGADGDPSLTMFGQAITPNQHAVANRFGIFDNAYTNSQVSADGHNWTDAAFANDYVERFWPPTYGDRRDLNDLQDGTAPDVPHSGYLWDAAKHARLSYRDYGEAIEFRHGFPIGLTTFPGLAGHFDPAYVGWDLRTSDNVRFAEWLREFRRFEAARALPQLEIVYLPNDHTSGTSPGMPTPQAYVATNDWSVGRLVDTISHSADWKSSAVFILEDDAQNGPDHVSDQRSTFYIASPYARGGLQHAHYSTASFVRTIELLLGLAPLSVYDATARPLYAAFATSAVNVRPFNALVPHVDMRAVNAKTAYKAGASARLNFTRPDAIDPRVLNDIIEHAGHR